MKLDDASTDVLAKPDRRSFIGGSDTAAILGVSPWKTPLTLWQEKTGKVLPVEPSKAKQKIFERGKMLEPIVLQMVVNKLEEQGHTVEIVATNKYYTDEEHDFLRCEIDFELIIDGEHINGDCKTAHGFARKAWGEEETEEVPIYYAAQFMHGLMITKRQRCIVAVLIGLDDVAIYWVNRDDKTVAAIRAKEVMFWNDHILKDVPPDFMVFDDITALYPRDDGTSIEATAEIVDRVRDFKRVKAEIKGLEQEEEELKFQIAAFIQPHSQLTYAGDKVATWKAQSSTRLDGKSLEAAHPELAAQFKRTTVSRVLRV